MGSVLNDLFNVYVRMWPLIYCHVHLLLCNSVNEAAILETPAVHHFELVKVLIVLTLVFKQRDCTNSFSDVRYSNLRITTSICMFATPKANCSHVLESERRVA